MATCTICNGGLPLAKTMLGKVLTPVALNLLNLRESRTPLEKVAVVLTGLAVGHLIDKALIELFGSTCAECQRGAPAT